MPILRYFNEEIACKIGLQEAIVLQQIEYWIKTNEKAEKNFHDDHYWTFNSLEDWARQFPFWSKKTTQRTLEKLREQKILITSNEYNRRQNDQTLWYRIDYEKLKEITMDNLTIPLVNLTIDTEEKQEEKQEPFSQFDHNDIDKMTTDLSQSDQIELDSLTTTLPIVSNSYTMVSYSYEVEKEKEKLVPIDTTFHIGLGTWKMIYEGAYKQGISYPKVLIKESDISEIVEKLNLLWPEHKKKTADDMRSYIYTQKELKQEPDLLECLKQVVIEVGLE